MSFFDCMEVCSALIFHLAFHGTVPMLLTDLCLSHLLDSFCSSLCYTCSSVIVLLALVPFFQQFCAFCSEAFVCVFELFLSISVSVVSIVHIMNDLICV